MRIQSVHKHSWFEAIEANGAVALATERIVAPDVQCHGSDFVGAGTGELACTKVVDVSSLSSSFKLFRISAAGSQILH